jgi:hypothetical protein
MSPRERENWAVVNPALVPDVETHLWCRVPALFICCERINPVIVQSQNLCIWLWWVFHLKIWLLFCHIKNVPQPFLWHNQNITIVMCSNTFWLHLKLISLKILLIFKSQYFQPFIEICS